MVNVTIEFEARVIALAAEGGLEKSSFKFGFRLSNWVMAIPDLRASGAEASQATGR